MKKQRAKKISKPRRISKPKGEVPCDLHVSVRSREDILAQRGYETAVALRKELEDLRKLDVGGCKGSLDASLMKRLSKLRDDFVARFPSRMFTAAFILKTCVMELPTRRSGKHEARELLLGFGPAWCDDRVIFTARPQLGGTIESIIVPSTTVGRFVVTDIRLAGRSLFKAVIGKSILCQVFGEGVFPRPILTGITGESFEADSVVELHVRRIA